SVTRTCPIQGRSSTIASSIQPIVVPSLCGPDSAPKRRARNSGPFHRSKTGRSDRVVHLVLDRRGLVLPGVDLFPLELHVGVDLVVGEDAALGQEGAVGVEAVERLAQAA